MKIFRKWNEICGTIFFASVGDEVLLHATLLGRYCAPPGEGDARTGWYNTSFNSLEDVQHLNNDLRESSELEFVLFTGHSIEASLERDKAAGYI